MVRGAARHPRRRLAGAGRNNPARRSGRRHRPAFSLLELMIAIVILGIGLIMVATMFPIAWGRARDLADQTTQLTMTDLAHKTCDMLLSVDGTAGEDVSDFAGDLVYDEANGFFALADTRVFALHMENARAGDPSGAPAGTIYPPRGDAKRGIAPWELSFPPGLPGDIREWPFFSYSPVQFDKTYPFYSTGYGAPQIRLEQRVHPPLPLRNDIDLTSDDGVFKSPPDYDDWLRWENEFDSKRYAFAVFHKLNERIGPFPGEFGTIPETASAAAAAITKEREFTMYYASLRRPSPTLRYAQQDPAFAPDPGDPANTSRQIAALPAENDLLLPVPWRVQIYFEPASDPDNPVGFQICGGGVPKGAPNKYADPCELPTVAQINHPDLKTGLLALDFFSRGTLFIDERNGQVYEVTEVRRVEGAGSDVGLLTLDREVVVRDLDDSPFGNANNFFLDADEAARIVWVFPPPVQRPSANQIVFSGNPPVIAIDTRTLVRTP